MGSDIFTNQRQHGENCTQIHSHFVIKSGIFMIASFISSEESRTFIRMFLGSNENSCKGWVVQKTFNIVKKFQKLSLEIKVSL